MACVIGTAGHIDHGKTTLIKALTGIDTDRLKEEKKRGLSIDLGFAYMDIPGLGRVPVVDVPGHERFIKNMLAGVTGIDLVLFVVAADDGIMPQTREHLDIVHLLGVEKGIFVITKTDLVDAGRVRSLTSEVEALVEGTVLRGSPVVSVSSQTGEGLETLKSLIARICGGLSSARSGDLFRLPVDRVFPIKGFGTVVTGTVASGRAVKGDELFCFPRCLRVRVRGIQSLFRETDEVRAGERAALNISGISHNEVERGCVLTSTELEPFLKDAVRRPLMVDCRFEFLPSMSRPFKSGRKLKVHHMTDEALATVRLYGGGEARPGESVFGRLNLKSGRLVMLRGDRFILRDPSINTTIGGGRVLAAYPPGYSAAPVNRVPYGSLEKEDMEQLFEAILQEGSPGMDKSFLGFMLNMSAREVIEGVKRSGQLKMVDDFVVSRKRADVFKGSVMETLKRFHKENPAERGMGEEDLLRGGAAAEALKKAFIDEMVEAGEVVREGRLLRLPWHSPALSGGDARIEKALLPLFSSKDGLFRSVSTAELGKLPFNRKDINRVIGYMLERGRIVRLKQDTFISRDAVDEAGRRLMEYLRSKGRIKAAEFRDLLGCGRKLAIEILEYFDRERLTIRQGDFRVLR